MHNIRDGEIGSRDGSVLAPRVGIGRHQPSSILTQWLRPDEPLAAPFERLAEQLAAAEAALLGLMIYGSVDGQKQIEEAMRIALGETDWPVTWVDGGSCDGLPIAGIQAFVVSGRPVTRVRLGRTIVASVYEEGGARYCLLGGIGPTAVTTPVGAQVQQALGNLEWALDNAGFALGDVFRTWFYNDDILSWYNEFNRVRSAHYASVAWRTRSLPASTGIGARNPRGAALNVAAWAMQPLDGAASAQEVGSPLQCPAPRYGSAFSRAMEIRGDGCRRLLISGTASIYSDGRTAWKDNAKKQVDLTMEVIAAILHARSMSFDDVTRATAYFQHPKYKPHFDTWIVTRELEHLPVVSVHADVCRDDLLFELELDAMAEAK